MTHEALDSLPGPPTLTASDVWRICNKWWQADLGVAIVQTVIMYVVKNFNNHITIQVLVTNKENILGYKHYTGVMPISYNFYFGAIPFVGQYVNFSSPPVNHLVLL